MSNDIIPDWTITSNTHLLRSRWRMEGWRLKRWRMDDGRLELVGVSGADGLCLNITDTTKMKEEEPLSVFGAAAVASCLLGSTCSRSPRRFTCRDQCCVVSLLAPALPFLPPPLYISCCPHTGCCPCSFCGGSFSRPPSSHPHKHE